MRILIEFFLMNYFKEVGSLGISMILPKNETHDILENCKVLLIKKIIKYVMRKFQK